MKNTFYIYITLLALCLIFGPLRANAQSAPTGCTGTPNLSGAWDACSGAYQQCIGNHPNAASTCANNAVVIGTAAGQYNQCVNNGGTNCQNSAPDSMLTYMQTPDPTTINPTVTPNSSGVTCIDPNEPNPPVYQPDPTTGKCPSYAPQARYNGQQAPQGNGNLPNYVPLEPIPGLNQTGNANFGQLLSQLFKVLIIIGALVAVGAFVYAGISYMFSEVPGVKLEARARLTAALWGLLLLVGAWVILFTINPQLVTFGGGLSPQTGNFFTTPQQAQMTPIQQDITNCTNSGGTPTYTPAPTGNGFTTCNDRTFMQTYFSFTDCRPMSSGGVCLIGKGTTIGGSLINNTGTTN